MRKSMFAILGSAALFVAVPTTAQEVPLVPGDYWEVAEIDVNDGGGPAYADYLASRWRQNQEFAKSKGWIKDYMIFSVVNRRADEPDLYLVTIFDRAPSAAEQMSREKEFDAFLKSNARQESTAYAARGTMRKVGGEMLLQRLLFRN